MLDYHSKNGWTRIGGVRSSSNPTKFYIVAQRTTGYLGCDCPSYIYQRGVKNHLGHRGTCKHIRQLLDESISLNDLDLTNFGLRWLLERRVAQVAVKKYRKKAA